jgi:hypothetical protein
MTTPTVGCFVETLGLFFSLPGSAHVGIVNRQQITRKEGGGKVQVIIAV